MSIPSVGVERLRLVARVQNRKRKRTNIINEQMNDRLRTYTNMLDRHCTMVSTKAERNAVPLQRTLVDIRSYAMALAERGHPNLVKCQSVDGLPPYGLYEGATQRICRYDIERIKEEYRPEKVRARKAEKLVVEGHKTGKIMPQHEVPYKFHELMNRKYDLETGLSLSQGSNHSPSTGIVLPPIGAQKSLVTLKTKRDKLDGLRRAHTYYGT